MLSYHAISVAQVMHAERGATIDRRSGTRAATTFRNDPSTSPGARKSAANDSSTIAVSAGRLVALNARLAGETRRRVGRGVHDGNARHADGRRDQRPRVRIDGVVEDHGAAEHRPFAHRLRVDLHRVRREETALQVGADHLDRVADGHLAAVRFAQSEVVLSSTVPPA